MSDAIKRDDRVTVVLSDNGRRALAYAAALGIERCDWPSEQYRQAAIDARELLIAASSPESPRP